MSRRLYPSHPIIGVGALIEKDGRYLLIKRGVDPDKGLWSVPGELVEIGERIVEAATREALEETGLFVQEVDRIVARAQPNRYICNEPSNSHGNKRRLQRETRYINERLQSRTVRLHSRYRRPDGRLGD